MPKEMGKKSDQKPVKASPYQPLVDAIDRQTDHIKKPEKQISKRRELMGGGLISLGNLSLASLFFGQAFGGFQFEVNQAVAGAVVWLILNSIAYKLLQKK